MYFSRRIWRWRHRFGIEPPSQPRAQQLSLVAGSTASTAVMCPPSATRVQGLAGRGRCAPQAVPQTEQCCCHRGQRAVRLEYLHGHGVAGSRTDIAHAVCLLSGCAVRGRDALPSVVVGRRHSLLLLSGGLLCAARPAGVRLPTYGIGDTGSTRRYCPLPKRGCHRYPTGWYLPGCSGLWSDLRLQRLQDRSGSGYGLLGLYGPTAQTNPMLLSSLRLQHGSGRSRPGARQCCHCRRERFLPVGSRRIKRNSNGEAACWFLLAGVIVPLLSR